MDMIITSSSSVLISLVFIGAISVLVLEVVKRAWIRPKKIEKCLREQGLGGNPYKFFIGDIWELTSVTKQAEQTPINFDDSVAQHVLPYFHQSITKYGENSIVWFGIWPRLNIVNPELMKEILTRTDDFQKVHPDPIGETILGGLLYLEGDKWAKHRKIVNPAFLLERLKDAVPAMRKSCSIMIEKWEAILLSASSGSETIDVWLYIEELSGDVISRAAFGSSHEEGKKIFQLQQQQIKLVLKLLSMAFLPGWRHVPTKTNRRMKAMSREIHSLLRGIIDKRQKAMEKGEDAADDLLGTLMESNYREMQENGGISIEDVIEECKLFYFAGSETTSNLLVWTLVSLSQHKEWQLRAREEVLQVFGDKEPTFDGLNRLKVATMILQEVLRLYSPASHIVRAATKTTTLGNMVIPKGTQFTLLIGFLHCDPKIWGEDAKEFKPHRFSQGVSSATNTPFSFIPFSGGPRVCIGQNFSMIEAKIALSMILQRYKFELSPGYAHAPLPFFGRPQFGAHLILSKLQ